MTAQATLLDDDEASFLRDVLQSAGSSGQSPRNDGKHAISSIHVGSGPASKGTKGYRTMQGSGSSHSHGPVGGHGLPGSLSRAQSSHSVQAGPSSSLRPRQKPTTIHEMEVLMLATMAGRGSWPLEELAEDLCRAYNDAAMACMNGGQLPQAYELLQKAVILSEPGGALESSGSSRRSHWLAVTYNNLGCYYKRQRKAQAALHYLQKAAELEGCSLEGGSPASTGTEPTQKPEDAASTLLNLCAVLSSLNRHEQAAQHADRAAELLCASHGLSTSQVVRVASTTSVRATTAPKWQAWLASSTSPTKESQDEEERTSSPSRREAPQPAGTSSDEASTSGAAVWDKLRSAPVASTSVLAMALYNKAVEMEHLGQFTQALPPYSAAAQLASRLLGSQSALAVLFGKTLMNFRNRLNAERRKAAAGAGTRGTEGPSEPRGRRRSGPPEAEASSRSEGSSAPLGSRKAPKQRVGGGGDGGNGGSRRGSSGAAPPGRSGSSSAKDAAAAATTAVEQAADHRRPSPYLVHMNLSSNSRPPSSSAACTTSSTPSSPTAGSTEAARTLTTQPTLPKAAGVPLPYLNHLKASSPSSKVQPTRATPVRSSSPTKLPAATSPKKAAVPSKLKQAAPVAPTAKAAAAAPALQVDPPDSDAFARPLPRALQPKTSFNGTRQQAGSGTAGVGDEAAS